MTDARAVRRLLRTGSVLEGITLGWNVVGVALLAVIEANVRTTDQDSVSRSPALF